MEESQLAGPLVQPHLRELHAPAVGVCDREFVTSFRCPSPRHVHRTLHAAPTLVHAALLADVGSGGCRG